MRDQPIATAIRSNHQPYRCRANTGTPKKANAAPVCPEGNAWYLFLNNKNSRSRHRPFHSWFASVLLGRARPETRRTELTTAPAIVEAIIMQSKSLQRTRFRAHQAETKPIQPKSINSGQSPQLLSSPAKFLSVFKSWDFTHWMMA